MKDMIIRLIILCLFMTYPVWAFADNNDNIQQPSPKDFAYGFLLKPEGEGAIYKIILSEDIYRSVTRTDLGDIRVFNNEGEIVPHAIRQPESLSSNRPEPVLLPFFPIYEAKGNKTESLSLYFTTNKEGVILQANTVPADKEGGVVNAYLLDISALNREIDQLQLEWTQNRGSFVTSVSVESSDDLTHWNFLVRKAALAELSYSGHNLGQHTIPLPNQKAKYLRISWIAGKEGTLLTGIKAIFPPLTPEQPRLRTRITAESVSDTPVIYEFDTNALFPAESINLILPQRNSLIQGVLKSRSDKNGEWRLRYRGIFYNLQIDENTLTNNEIRLSQITADRYWRLEITPESGDPGNITPILELIWIPHDFLFLARGNPPFQIAYGSTKIKSPPGRPIDILLNAINQDQKGIFIKNAQLGEKIGLGGEAMLNPLKPPFPFKQFLLWSVLIGGVFLLGWMAWRLYKQMGDSQS